MHILVADDDQISRGILANSLRGAGYAVTEAEDGCAALLELSRDDGPRVALIDWKMPGATGPEICREILQRREKDQEDFIYLILLTAKNSADDITMGLDAGADDYVTKSCDRSVLQARIRVGCRLVEYHDRLKDLAQRLKEQKERLEYQATHDSLLTSLWNYDATLSFLLRELERARREEGSTVVLFIDLDDFKRVNDTHGHLVGNEVLLEAARRLMSSVRPYDIVGRWGGDEFLVILADCSKQSCGERGERILRGLADEPYSTSAGALRVSASAGMAVSAGTDPRSAEIVLAEADAALYEAKGKPGRNSLCTAKSKNPSSQAS